MALLLRLLVVCLVALALPVQGIAAATRAHCGPSHQRMQGTVAQTAEDGRHAHGGHDAHVGHHGHGLHQAHAGHRPAAAPDGHAAHHGQHATHQAHANHHAHGTADGHPAAPVADPAGMQAAVDGPAAVTGAAASAATPASASADGTGSTADQLAKFKCSSCAACCVGSALARVMPRVPEPEAAATVFAQVPMAEATHTTGGPDRPPRTPIA